MVDAPQFQTTQKPLDWKKWAAQENLASAGRKAKEKQEVAQLESVNGSSTVKSANNEKRMEWADNDSSRLTSVKKSRGNSYRGNTA